MKKRLNKGKISSVLYWLLFIALMGLFFTNDFGLMDIHKTSIITAVGIDCPEEEVVVTAEVAVPQPSQSGENIKYTLVQGSGLTIADALDEINSKLGLYPKLQFCQLILVGETCRDKDVFRVLGCFYRKNYSELTTLVAMCEGNASDMLAMKSEVSDRTSEAIRNVLSDEINKSGNAIAQNLKDIALLEYSKSRACFMSYIQPVMPGTSQDGGNGGKKGGEPIPQEQQQGGEQQGQQGQSGQGGQGGEQGQSGGSGGGGGQQGQSGQSGQSGGQTVEFVTHKTAFFSEGHFKGVLDDTQSFALAVLVNKIRVAVLQCDAEDLHYTLGLKYVKSGVDLKVNNGVPEVTISFKAKALIQGVRVVVDPEKIMKDDEVSNVILQSANKEMERCFNGLIEQCVKTDSDLLGLKEMLYKFNNKYYDAFSNDLLSRIRVKYKIDIQSVS